MRSSMLVGGHALIFAVSAELHVLQERDCAITWSANDGDTCATLAESWNISEAQFLSYNPGAICSALEVGKEYCVEWTGTPPTLPSMTTSRMIKPTSVLTPTPTTLSIANAPSPTSMPVATCATTPTGVVTPSPIQTGMTCGCTKFHKIAVGDNCWLIANDNNISLESFYAWNPTNKDCKNLFPGDSVCVAKTSPVTTKPLAAPTTLVPLICRFDLSKGQYICPTEPPSPTQTQVENPPPSPTQAGIPPNCNKWISQKNGVYCYDMAKTAGITLARLYALNPALMGDCSGLWPGYAYCIGTS